MSKGYWLAVYKTIHDADRLAKYAEQAGVAITENGGVFLARGMPEAMLEGDQPTRTVLIEFPSAEAAMNTLAAGVRSRLCSGLTVSLQAAPRLSTTGAPSRRNSRVAASWSTMTSMVDPARDSCGRP